MSVNTESNHNSSNSQDLLISVPQKEEFQSYFTFCGHKRRFPIGENAGGLIVTTFLIIIPSFLYMTINFSLGMSRIDSVEELKGKVNSSTYIVFSVVSIITLILALISFYDVATSIPGYQTGKKITQEEFQKAINWISIKLNLDNHVYGFGKQEQISDWEFIKKYKKNKKVKPKDKILVPYDKNILNIFQHFYCQSWIEEGISVETMKKYNIL